MYNMQNSTSFSIHKLQWILMEQDLFIKTYH